MNQKPRCINHGCQNYATWTGKKFRPFCNTCHKANRGAGAYPKNVTPFKTGRCSNQDGHLGHPCPVNYDQAPWAVGMTEIDHIDGNDANNDPNNVQEVCPMCHKKKGITYGDFQRQRTVKIKRTTAEPAFDNLFE